MKRGLQGRLERRGGSRDGYSAFIPSPLPPDPPLRLTDELHDLLERANRALGRLDGLATLLPDPALFLYLYIRKEAVLSSQIEGTQSSFSELLMYESAGVSGVPMDDVQEVSRYVAAMNHGLQRLREGFPLSLRLVREIHSVLMAKGRGSEQTPGSFRTSQNWIGGSRPGNAAFVPPPQDTLLDHLGSLERFLHDDPVRTPTLIKAALAHVQFETIHPFLDGNGRLGRLLVTFLLCAEGALSEPLLYLSLYLKQNRTRYYDLLQQVRMEGDWEEWLAFFLRGVAATAEQASSTARRILTIFERDRTRCEDVGRSAGTVLRMHQFMRRNPVFTLPSVTATLGISFPTATAGVRMLESLGIVTEVTGRGRDRVYTYSEYLAVLNEGTELPENSGSDAEESADLASGAN
ncbi:Fic family protein [Longimicrobium sp.]|uniref:Fic family protein n=1 Tax=Longimicrobium sp. TaxID=2029185 RepID=UPI002CE8F2C9|nr:Fic family protein [Longimicrobium sp.]HSU13011.1 Fic family protein [Longimicrobium sp.]